MESGTHLECSKRERCGHQDISATRFRCAVQVLEQDWQGGPYFFPVSKERWQECLLEDELSGERVFGDIETYCATEDDEMLGFVQYGQPSFAWDANGLRLGNPHIGVIRHLYFEEDRPEVGHALLAKANAYLQRFNQIYAFYHALGISCNAHHGKLHSSLTYVEDMLRAYGFSVEHENVYYSLDMQRDKPSGGNGLRLVSTAERCGDEKGFEARLHGDIIGTAQVRLLERLTGGLTRDTVYLTWIGMHRHCRGMGLGTQFIQLLLEHLQREGYQHIHTDTASDNAIAQRFYKKLGFQNRGFTRSYLRE